MSKPPSVLVIRLSALGDVLFAAPMLEHLRASGRFGHIAWLVEDKAAGVVRDFLDVDELVVFPRSKPSAWPGYFAALRRRRDDVVLDLQGNLKSRLQRLFLRDGRRLGFGPPLSKEGGHRGLDDVFTPPPHARHRVAANISLLSELGVEPPADVPRPSLTVTDAARRDAERLVAGAQGAGPVVLMAPGTSRFGAFKRWPSEHYAEVGRALQRQLDARIVISGGPGEAELVAGASIAGSVTPPPAGLMNLAGLVCAADLVISPDSFPLHLANHIGTPVVALFGPKNPALTGPYFDRSEVVTAGVACSPCTLRRCSDPICMQRLAVDDVIAAAHRLLTERSA